MFTSAFTATTHTHTHTHTHTPDTPKTASSAATTAEEDDNNRKEKKTRPTLAFRVGNLFRASHWSVRLVVEESEKRNDLPLMVLGITYEVIAREPSVEDKKETHTDTHTHTPKTHTHTHTEDTHTHTHTHKHWHWISLMVVRQVHLMVPSVRLRCDWSMVVRCAETETERERDWTNPSDRLRSSQSEE